MKTIDLPGIAQGIAFSYLFTGIWMTYKWEQVSSSKGLSFIFKVASWLIATLGWPFGVKVLFKNFADLPPYAAIPPTLVNKKKKEEEKIDDADIPAQRIVRSTGNTQGGTRR